MCIVAFAWKAHPRWKLIAIGNRDEIHSRPADALSRWGDPSHLLAGRDIKAGGTWLGVSEQGRLAVVTNLSGHGTPDAEPASRGDLLKDFLSDDGRYSSLNATDFSDFNPFNLITVAGNKALIHSNRPHARSHILAPGIHGLSNGPIDKPWRKSGYLNSTLAAWIENESSNPGILLENLRDQTTFPLAPDAEPNSVSSLEPQNSAVFIRNPVYGTRCSTVVAIDHQGAGMITERRYAPSGKSTGDTRLSFTWPG
ncbi:MAG: NRDE family protein [Parasphingorhabdus sp.]|uniref:NRDE family protein n=1 Tax=Parasphingorhabdus sp. TaxID=2709688 RepID=UPI0030024FB0